MLEMFNLKAQIQEEFKRELKNKYINLGSWSVSIDLLQIHLGIDGQRDKIYHDYYWWRSHILMILWEFLAINIYTKSAQCRAIDNIVSYERTHFVIILSMLIIFFNLQF